MKRLNCILAFVIYVISTGAVNAQWSSLSTENDSIAVLGASDQRNPRIISDGNNGAIIVWEDTRFSSVSEFDIFAARLDKAATLFWGEEGVPVVQASGVQRDPAIVSNGQGGAYIAWQDARSNGTVPDVYAQQIAFVNGEPEWQLDGVLVQRRNLRPSLVRDSVFGVIMGAYRPAETKDLITVQKLNSDGVVQWASDLRLSQDAHILSTRKPPISVSDANGGAFFAWVDGRTGTGSTLYAARVGQNGTPAWLNEEVRLSTLVTEGTETHVCADGNGGVIIAWVSPETAGSSNDKIMGQRLDATGTAIWAAGGVEVSTTSATKRNVRVAQADASTFIFLWEDLSTGRDRNIIAQRVGIGGAPLGQAIDVVVADGDQVEPAVIPNRRTGVIVAWEDNRNSSTSPDIYAQLIDASGSIGWTLNGQAVSTAPGAQQLPALTHDGLGGAIIAWQDSRDSDLDIYSQRVSITGVLGEFRTLRLNAPTSTSNWEVGSRQVITWTTQGEIDSVAIQLSLDGGQTYLDDLIATGTRNTGSFTLSNVPDEISDNAVIRITSLKDNHIRNTSPGFTISPAEAPDLDADVLEEASMSDSLEIVATTSDLSGIKEVALHYRRGGAAVFDTVAMRRAAITSQYLGVIPGSAVTNRGVEYFVSSTDSVGNTGYSDTVFVSVTFGAGVQTKEINSGRSQTSYRMISVPNLLNQVRVDSILAFSGFGVYDTTSWRLFDFRDSVNVEFDTSDASSFVFESGEAYWLISGRSRTIDFGAGVSTPANKDYEMLLQPGWNQIGNPFAFSIDWNDIEAASGFPLVSSPSTYRDFYVSPATIEPYEGYFVYRFGDTDTTLVIPPVEAIQSTSVTKTAPADGSNWHLQIIATSQEARDEFNYLGVDAKAAIEWDRMDQPEPPAIGKFISVHFPQKNWKRFAFDYTTDYRPGIGDGQTWNVNVTTNVASSDLRLSFEGIAKVPETFGIILVDETLTINQDLRKEPEYIMSTGAKGLNKNLKILIGNAEYLVNQTNNLDFVPDDYRLSQNFPNPFNPSTSIRFGLPQDENVTIRVFDILGREVVTLVSNEPRTAGFHLVTWNGRDKNSLPVASGLYIYQISAGKFSQTRKMLLVK